MQHDLQRAPLEARAWDAWYLDPAALAAATRDLWELAARDGDPVTASLASLFAARSAMIDGQWPAAAAALDEAAQAAGSQGRLCFLIGLTRAWLHLRQGQPRQAALQLAACGQPGEPTQSMPDQALFHTVGQELAMQTGHFDDALQEAYRAVQAARRLGGTGFLCAALHNLATDQLNLLNLEDALPLQLEAKAQLQQAGGARLMHMSWTNLILIYDIQGRADEAAAALSAWEAEPGGVSAEHRLSHPVALSMALLCAGRTEEALQVSRNRPTVRETDRHRLSAWTWARARVLLRCGQAAQARQMCEAELATASQGQAPQTPYNLVRLNDVIREACETSGDYQGALEAQKAAQRASLPMLGQSARARCVSLRIQLQQQAGQAIARAPQEQVRLNAIDASIQQAGRTLQAVHGRSDDSVAEHRKYVAKVGHEIRGALNGVMGMNSLLLMSSLDARQERFVRIAQDSARTVLNLVNDILDIAKLEAGKFDLRRQRIDIARIVHDVTAMFEAQALAKGLLIRANVEPGLPELLGDELRLKQILTNLVSNGLKFTERGSVTVQVTARDAQQQSARKLFFVVEDTGCGIPAEELPQLFREFSQAASHSRAPQEGTGLGLVLSRQLIRRFGGEIQVHSTPGQGTRFSFEIELPVAG